MKELNVSRREKRKSITKKKNNILKQGALIME